MTLPNGTTHFDYVNHCFYRIVDNKAHKYNGFGWQEVFYVDFDNLMVVE